MKTWEWSPASFISAGPGDMLPDNDRVLYAPDGQYRDGKYYLYFCQPGRIAPGVAVGTSPTGPFAEPGFLNVGPYPQIDPSVFIDDDGQAYFMWGQFDLKIARLNPDMRTLDSSSIQDKVLTEKDHFFHEGAYMTKRNGLYYLVFADVSRAGRPTCLGYATSQSPMGPYTYRGVIIDNDRCDPGNWNNHGSIVEFGGQWYVFYHRSTHGSRMMRKACVEPISFREDGSIPEVEMTTQGAGQPIEARERIEAEQACFLDGDLRVMRSAGGNELLHRIAAGDCATYKYLDFSSTPKRLRLRLQPAHEPVTISFHLNFPWGPTIASTVVPASDNKAWREVVCDAKTVTGVHGVVVRFRGAAGAVLDWWQFE